MRRFGIRGGETQILTILIIVSVLTAVRGLAENRQQYGELPDGWQQWKRSNGGICYINFNTKEAQDVDPTSNRGKNPKRENILTLPTDLKGKVKLFRLQLTDKQNVVQPITNMSNIVSESNLFDDAYRDFNGVKLVDELKKASRIAIDNPITDDFSLYYLKDWFSRLFTRIFDPRSEFFRYTSDDYFWINEKFRYHEYYELIGKIVATAVYHKQPIDVYCTEAFYKLMLEKPLHLEDIKTINPSLYEDLIDGQFSKYTSPDERSDYKRDELIKRIIERKIVTPVQSHMSYFLQGFSQLIPVHLLKIFEPDELKLLIGGVEEIEDTLDWRANTKYSNSNKMPDNFSWFWNIVDELSNHQRRQLMKFATGLSRIPVNGFADLYPEFKLAQYVNKDEPLLEAEVSFNAICLWKYENEEEFKKKLVHTIADIQLNEFTSNSQLYGILPRGWQRWTSRLNEWYYINHETKELQLEDPRSKENSSLTSEAYPEDLKNKIQHFKDQLPFVASLTEFGISIDRSNILDSTYKFIGNIKSMKALKQILVVNFRNENEHSSWNKANEWFSLWAMKIFDPSSGFFQYATDDKTKLQINPNAKDLEYFKVIGMMVGMAVYHQKYLGAYFIKPFYTFVLRKRIELEDIMNLDSDHYHEIVRQVKEKPAYPGRFFPGKSQEFFQQIAIRKNFLEPVEAQMEAFVKGFQYLVPLHLLKIFQESDLETLIGGVSVIDVDDWQHHTDYVDCNGQTTVVQWFWNIVNRLTTDEKARLLLFATGTVRVSIDGFQSLSPRFTIQVDLAVGDNSQRLPVADRSSNHITLPNYSNLEELAQNLQNAITQYISTF